jgi:hypothetical protein
LSVRKGQHSTSEKPGTVTQLLDNHGGAKLHLRSSEATRVLDIAWVIWISVRMPQADYLRGKRAHSTTTSSVDDGSCQTKALGTSGGQDASFTPTMRVGHNHLPTETAWAPAFFSSGITPRVMPGTSRWLSVRGTETGRLSCAHHITYHYTCLQDPPRS